MNVAKSGSISSALDKRGPRGYVPKAELFAPFYRAQKPLWDQQVPTTVRGFLNIYLRSWTGNCLEQNRPPARFNGFEPLLLELADYRL